MQVKAVLLAGARFGQLEDQLQGVVERAPETLELDEELCSGDGPDVEFSRCGEVRRSHVVARLLLREEAGWDRGIGSAHVNLSES